MAEPSDQNGSTQIDASAKNSDAPTSGPIITPDPESIVGPESKSQVAQHYNAVPEVGLEKRTESRIFYLRNFNNWIKSMLIGETLDQIKRGREKGEPISVLDMCCGKGGDLFKWKKGEISRLVCSDIADVSLEQCKVRYDEMIERNNRDRRPQKMFSCEFINADLSKLQLKQLYSDPKMKFDLCSCQFSLHYSFFSEAQAKCMLRNACENLKNGGYFIGTIPNAERLVHLARRSEDFSFKNEVCTVKFENDLNEKVLLFGTTYNFTLDEVVNDLPEYLVYFPLLVELLKEFNMEFVSLRTFPEVVEEKSMGEGRGLLGRMQALEPYPPEEGFKLLGNGLEQYEIAANKLEELKSCADSQSKKPICLGTLSKAEWEVACMYSAFVFKKKEP